MADKNLSIGWIGAGRMGSEMIRRVAEAGFDVSVYNRTRSKVDGLLAYGAKAADSVAVLAGCDVVFAMVGSSEDFLSVTIEDGGVLRQELAPKVIVDCSTVSVEASVQVREFAAVRSSSLLAAPVSGNPKVARAGRLTMAVSGPKDAYELVLPVLEAIVTGVTYVGDGDLARLVKLCHNLFLGVVTQSLAEITIMAEKGGVSRSTFLEYLNKSVMGSTFTRYKSPAFVNLDYHATFTSRLLRKDFDLGLQAARSLEVPMPTASAVYQAIQALVGEGRGEEDFAALIELEARASGVKLASEGVEVDDGLG